MINTTELDAIAHLARLYLTDAEKQAFAKDLQEIFTWIDQLPDEQITPPPAPLCPSVMRPDEVTEGNIPEAILSNAPASTYQMFSVPPILG